MPAYYLHDLSPYIVRLTDGIALHWYGLAYVLGFYCCYLVMRSLARRGYGELKEEQVGDFIVLVALFGVVIGGRLGHVLLYKPGEYLRHPLDIFLINKGGMASHGGILGVFLVTLWYARRHRLSWPGLGDNLVVGAPLGILFGRLANFINGELWGHPATVPWAVKFPTELAQSGAPPSFFGVITEGNRFPAHSSEILELAGRFPGSLEKIEAALPPRHPSQLYEALLEGLLLFAVLYWVRTRSRELPRGLLTGLFFVLYAVVRIIGETFRVPDASLIMGVTRGQFYSVFMIGIGLAFLWHASSQWRRRRVGAG